MANVEHSRAQRASGLGSSRRNDPTAENSHANRSTLSNIATHGPSGGSTSSDATSPMIAIIPVHYAIST